MPTPQLKQSSVEVLENLDADWIIYATENDLFYDKPTYNKIPKGTAVGINFPAGEIVLFKNVFILDHDPSKVKKALDMAQKLNIIEATTSSINIDFFYETKIQNESNSNRSQLLP